MASEQPEDPYQKDSDTSQQGDHEPIVDTPEDVLGRLQHAIQADIKEATAGTDVQAQLPLATAEEEAFSQDDQTGTGQLIARAEAASKHADTQDKQSQTRLREQLAERVFTFMERWCAYVALIFWIYISTKEGDVPSEVMIALLTTTTVSVIGLVGFVVQGLFRARPSPSETKDN